MLPAPRHALIGLDTPVDLGTYNLVVGAPKFRPWRKANSAGIVAIANGDWDTAVVLAERRAAAWAAVAWSSTTTMTNRLMRGADGESWQTVTGDVIAGPRVRDLYLRG